MERAIGQKGSASRFKLLSTREVDILQRVTGGHDEALVNPFKMRILPRQKVAIVVLILISD